jgi:hypothetical protein
MLYVSLTYPMHATCPTHLTIPDLMTLKPGEEKQVFQRRSMHNLPKLFPQYSVYEAKQNGQEPNECRVSPVSLPTAVLL